MHWYIVLLFKDLTVTGEKADLSFRIKAQSCGTFVKTLFNPIKAGGSESMNSLGTPPPLEKGLRE